MELYKIFNFYWFWLDFLNFLCILQRKTQEKTKGGPSLSTRKAKSPDAAP